MKKNLISKVFTRRLFTKSRRVSTLMFGMVFLAGVFAGCGAEATSADTASGLEVETPASAEKISVVTTFFPEYDWVKQVVGDNDNVDVTMLLDSGTDLHSYQPTADDVMKIAACDVFIYVGGESDEWVDDALKEATNEDMQVINLMEVLSSKVKEEEIIEGMMGEEEEEAEGEEEEEEGPEYDEHVWLSVKNAQVVVDAIVEAMSTVDASNADNYAANGEAYKEKLSDLDKKYQEVVDSASNKTLLFGDRFPFRYMIEDYDLDYYAAFIGCSAETEASFETILFLANKVDELNLKYVLTIENSDNKIPNTIIENTKSKDAQIYALDSMQSVTATDVENGANYLKIMEENLEVLKTVLN